MGRGSGWGVAAAEYAGAAQGWTATGLPAPGSPAADALAESGARIDGDGIGRRGRVRAFRRFVWNGVAQLPAAPAVVAFTLSERRRVAAVLGVLELVLIGGAFLLRKLDAELHGRPPR